MRQRRWAAVGFLVLAVMTGWTAVAGALAVSPRMFELVYQGEIPVLPVDAHQIELWIPLASSRDGQKVLKREIQLAAPYRVTHDSIYGNEMLYVTMKPPFPEKLAFKVRYEALTDGTGFGRVARAKPQTLYLQPSKWMVVDDEIRRRALGVTEGKKSVVEKARAIFDDVIARMQYDKTAPGYGQGDSVRACVVGKGNCTDFHSLFIAMCMASEIPARFKIGFPLPEQMESQIPGYHCWAEYLAPDGWRQVDASEAWKKPEKREYYFGQFDVNKFFVSTGRDLRLVPAQKGEPLNYFFFPYAEADGRPLGDIQTAFYFKELGKEGKGT